MNEPIKKSKSKSSTRSDKSDEGSKQLVDLLNEQESMRSINLKRDFFTENIRLQNLSLFSTLKKQWDKIDAKPCQICKQNKKETLW